MPKKITNFSSALSFVAVLVVSILIAQTAGAIGSIFTADKGWTSWITCGKVGGKNPFFFYGEVDLH